MRREPKSLLPPNDCDTVMSVLDDLNDVTIKQFNDSRDIFAKEVDVQKKRLTDGEEVILTPDIMTKVICMQNRLLLQRALDIHYWGELTALQRYIAAGIEMGHDSKTKAQKVKYNLLCSQYTLLYQAMVDTGQPSWVVPPMSFLKHIRKQVDEMEDIDFFKKQAAKISWEKIHETIH